MRIYIGLGSNVGDRESHLRNAVSALEAAGISVATSASVYSTEPRDLEDQPWFLNTVVEVRTNLSPAALLEACLEIERRAGRLRDASKGPRPLDIDILLYKDEVIHDSALIVPHPRYRDRRFALKPLAEIAPDVPDPLCGLTMQQLLDLCPDQGRVELHSPPLL